MDEIALLLSTLGQDTAQLVDEPTDLVEIVLDLARPLEVRYRKSTSVFHDILVTKDQIDQVCSAVGAFGPDQRAGIDGTLHRISRILGRDGTVVGLTCRVGRAVIGAEVLLEDVVSEGKSVLLIGAPGRGKTTTLRGCAKYLSEDDMARVIVVDTSDEIAGAGYVPHPAVGRARKMSVPYGFSQHEVLIQAVENHWPDVLVVDEVSDALDVEAVRSIATRGIQLLGTVHGRCLADVLNSPVMSDLVGGVKTVTLGDEEAARRNCSKTIQERQFEPTFDVVVEMVDFDVLQVYHDVKRAVDTLLLGGTAQPEERRLLSGKMKVVRPERYTVPSIPTPDTPYRPSKHKH